MGLCSLWAELLALGLGTERSRAGPTNGTTSHEHSVEKSRGSMEYGQGALGVPGPWGSLAEPLHGAQSDPRREGTWAPTPALVQLVEQLEQLRVHAVDRLEE